MSYDSGHLGLVGAAAATFAYGYEDVELATTSGGVETGPQTGSFTYDDTAWGHVAGGILAALASAVRATVVQLMWSPVAAVPNFASLGIDAATNVTALQFSMAGFGDIDAADDNASHAANSLVTLADELPLTLPPNQVMLLRPTAITDTWTGRDGSNDALRTLWHANELGVVTLAMTLHQSNVRLPFTFQVQGWGFPA
jgi:hypothetical protein